MNLPFFIARRYLLSNRKANFINFISIASIVVVASSTAALIIVLSVFNGLEDLLHSLNNSFDPEIKIEAAEGKSFESSPELIEKIKSVKSVDLVTEVIEDYALVRYRDAVQLAVMKGVGDNFVEQKRIPDENIVEGEFKLKEGGVDYAVLGRGIQYSLSVAVNEPMYPLQVYYIKNVKSAGLDPSKLYVKKNIAPAGVFSIVQTFDENYIIVPLEFARDLLNYNNRRTSYEIKLKPGGDFREADRDLQQVLGDGFKVLNHEEQHVDLYRLLKMEKLFAFLALTMLLLIGSINIFFNLMMLALDKKKDIAVLSSMGANASQIRRIFLAEGALIALLGTCIGLALGGIFCWVQLNYGVISMGMETSVTQGYPVKIRFMDFVYVFLVVILITFLISSHPARQASRITAAGHL